MPAKAGIKSCRITSIGDTMIDYLTFDTCITKTAESMCNGSISGKVPISFINALVLLDLYYNTPLKYKQIHYGFENTLDLVFVQREKPKHGFPSV